MKKLEDRIKEAGFEIPNFGQEVARCGYNTAMEQAIPKIECLDMQLTYYLQKPYPLDKDMVKLIDSCRLPNGELELNSFTDDLFDYFIMLRAEQFKEIDVLKNALTCAMEAANGKLKDGSDIDKVFESLLEKK